MRISQLESTVSCETEKYKDLLKVKEELESDLARSTTELEGKCQALNRELEGKIQAITQSHEDCQSLEAELTSLKSCRNELQGAKAELKVHVHNLEGEVLALKEDLTQQITEKGEGLKKAEVNFVTSPCRRTSEKLKYQAFSAQIKNLKCKDTMSKLA